MKIETKMVFIETTRIAVNILHGALSHAGGALPNDVREPMYAGLELLETALRAARNTPVVK